MTKTAKTRPLKDLKPKIVVILMMLRIRPRLMIHRIPLTRNRRRVKKTISPMMRLKKITTPHLRI